MPIELTMPRLSDTMEAGTVIKWNVKEGDSVSAGDVVADIETDKATMEMQVYDDGTIAKILVEEGQSVPIGTTIAVITGEDEDAEEAAGGAPKPEQKGGGESKRETKDEAAPKRAKQQEDTVEEEVEEQAETGTRKQDANRAESAERAEEASVRRGSGSAKPSDTQTFDKQRATATQDQGNGRMRVSPVARRLAEEHQVDLGAIQGSGPSGRIIKRDVLSAVETGKETRAAVPPSAREAMPARRRERDEDRGALPATRVSKEGQREFGPRHLEDQIVSLSNMRQTIAKRLVQSKQTIPHYQVTATFAMDALMDLRKELNQQLEAQGVKLSVNDFLVRACALAMYEHPFFNASWTDEGLHVHGEINIGIAISLPIERGGGLVVGTIHDADRRSLREISWESRELAEKARTRGLSVEEMSDSTFTLSNLGMFGVDHFTAIINPPNSAILAIGAALQKPVVRDGELAVGWEMSATLSCDHRVIDGAMAAQYLQTLLGLLESPATLLV